MADWSGAEAYTRSFALLCAGAVPALLDLLAEVAPRPASLLDVGTGTGSAARVAASRGWAVTAIEPEAAMRAVAARAGVEAADGALPRLPVPSGAFDGVVASFVLNHVPDPRAGARELHRVARPGGGVAVSIWGSAPGALSVLWSEVMAAADVSPPPGIRLPAERDFARTEDGLRDLLTGAGLSGVRTAVVDFAVDLPRDDLWDAVEAGIGVIGTTWRSQSPDRRATMRDAYRRRVREDLLRVPAEALLAAGRA